MPFFTSTQRPPFFLFAVSGAMRPSDPGDRHPLKVALILPFMRVKSLIYNSITPARIGRWSSLITTFVTRTEGSASMPRHQGPDPKASVLP